MCMCIYIYIYMCIYIYIYIYIYTYILHILQLTCPRPHLLIPVIPVSVNKKHYITIDVSSPSPPDKSALGTISLKSTKSGAESSFCWKTAGRQLA